MSDSHVPRDVGSICEWKYSWHSVVLRSQMSLRKCTICWTDTLKIWPQATTGDIMIKSSISIKGTKRDSVAKSNFHSSSTTFVVSPPNSILSKQNKWIKMGQNGTVGGCSEYIYHSPRRRTAMIYNGMHMLASSRMSNGVGLQLNASPVYSEFDSDCIEIIQDSK